MTSHRPEVGSPRSHEVTKVKRDKVRVCLSDVAGDSASTREREIKSGEVCKKYANILNTKELNDRPTRLNCANEMLSIFSSVINLGTTRGLSFLPGKA